MKSKNCSTPEKPETPENLCDQAVLELAYASGLRLAELRNLRLEQLHLEAGFINVIGKGNKERVVPVGRKAVEALNRYIETGRPKLVTPRSPANVFLTKRGTPFASVTFGCESRTGFAAPELRATSRRTCCGTVLPRICWSMARTCG